MNERDWQRLERRLIDAHVGADPPLSRKIWRGVEAGLVVQPARRGLRLAMGIAVVVAAAAVALWFLPTERPVSTAGRAPSGMPSSTIPPVPAVSDTARPGGPAKAVTPARAGESAAAVRAAEVRPARGGEATSPVRAAESTSPGRAGVAAAGGRAEQATGSSLNQVLETTRAVTFAIAADAGRIEVEPCKGRFVNVTVLDSPHRALQLVVRERRVEARFDGGALLASGVAHVLLPADTHLIIATRSGPVVVRGLGGPMEIDTRSGDVRVDTSSRTDPVVTMVSDSGAVGWQGKCGRGCRIDARSRIGDVTLRTPDPSVFTQGAARGESQAGRVHLEELTCADSRCSSSPLPWRQVAPGKGH